MASSATDLLFCNRIDYKCVRVGQQLRHIMASILLSSHPVPRTETMMSAGNTNADLLYHTIILTYLLWTRSHTHWLQIDRCKCCAHHRSSNVTAQPSTVETAVFVLK